MSSRHLVFLYGTLRQDKANHYRLLDPANGEARFLGLATTVEKYPLVIASRYNIPYLLAAPGHGKNVHGEVYEVDDLMLQKCDELEDHPTYYERKVTKMRMDESGKEVDCWVYLLHRYKPYMMELPFLDDYKLAVDNDPDNTYKLSKLIEIVGNEYWTDVKLDDPSP